MSNQWKLVPVEPTETMVINGFESEPDECFTDEEVLEQYRAMSGCQQAAFRAKLCWAAMLAAAPVPPLPIYDEVKERKLFEVQMVLDSNEAGYGEPDLHREVDGTYRQGHYQSAWGGWIRCAQSRAKAGEVGHE